LKVYGIKRTTNGIKEYFQGGEILLDGKRRSTWGWNPHQAKPFKTRNEADIEQHSLGLRGRVICLSY